MRVAKPRKLTLFGDKDPAKFTVSVSAKASLNASNVYTPIPFGRAKHQPPNVPPPTYVLGKPLVLHLNGTDKYTPPSARAVFDDLDDLDVAPVIPAVINTTAQALVKRITPAACSGPTDTPTTLPTLKYYCNLMPNICQNIRSHPAWTGDSMELTYDPFSASTGARRRGVCTVAVKAAYQAAGKCDLRQHNPAYWRVCLERYDA